MPEDPLIRLVRVGPLPDDPPVRVPEVVNGLRRGLARMGYPLFGVEGATQYRQVRGHSHSRRSQMSRSMQIGCNLNDSEVIVETTLFKSLGGPGPNEFLTPPPQPSPSRPISCQFGDETTYLDLAESRATWRMTGVVGERLVDVFGTAPAPTAIALRHVNVDEIEQPPSAWNTGPPPAQR